MLLALHKLSRLYHLQEFTFFVVSAATLGGCAHFGGSASPPSISIPQTGIHSTPASSSVATSVAPPRAASIARESYHQTRSIEVFVATNRKHSGNESDSGPCTDRTFGTEADPTVSLLKCKLNLPRLRAVGSIEATQDPRGDTHRYLRVLDGETVSEKTEWLEDLREGSPAGILIFIHGFNVKFEEALLRAGQIAYDLKFQGKVVLLTWPAGPAEGFFETTRLSRTYQANSETARASVEPFTTLLHDLSSLGIPTYITIHSMGHQVALRALASLPEAERTPWIQELFLNAPDFPVDEFRKVTLGALRKLAKRITLYCSYQDNAMVASELVNKSRRLGACERFDGVDVVNVSEVDAPALGIGGLGHGYYAGRAVLTDIHQALEGIQARDRLFIREGEPNSPEHFFLRP